MTKNSICDDIWRQKALGVGRSWSRGLPDLLRTARGRAWLEHSRRDGGRKWGRACGHSGPLWVNGGGLLLKEGYGWVTERSEGRSGGEKSPGPLLTVPGLERTSMFRKRCLDKCQWGWGWEGHSCVKEGTWRSNLSRAQIQDAEIWVLSYWYQWVMEGFWPGHGGI